MQGEGRRKKDHLHLRRLTKRVIHRARRAHRSKRRDRSEGRPPRPGTSAVEKWPLRATRKSAESYPAVSRRCRTRRRLTAVGFEGPTEMEPERSAGAGERRRARVKIRKGREIAEAAAHHGQRVRVSFEDRKRRSPRLERTVRRSKGNLEPRSSSYRPTGGDRSRLVPHLNLDSLSPFYCY